MWMEWWRWSILSFIHLQFINQLTLTSSPCNPRKYFCFPGLEIFSSCCGAEIFSSRFLSLVGSGTMLAAANTPSSICSDDDGFTETLSEDEQDFPESDSSRGFSELVSTFLSASSVFSFSSKAMLSLWSSS